MTTRLAIPEAARVLGVSIPTVKRRLKSGALAGEQEPTPSGFRWVVLLEPPESPAESPPAAPGESPEPPGASLAPDRAREMATYTRELLLPYVAKIEQQAERIGRLEEQLAAAQTQKTRQDFGGFSWWRRLWA
jgi:hypothetical protein